MMRRRRLHSELSFQTCNHRREYKGFQPFRLYIGYQYCAQLVLHEQIYAYPFIPPRIATELKQIADYREATGKYLLCKVRSEEFYAKLRLVAENNSFVAVIPFFARWP